MKVDLGGPEPRITRAPVDFSPNNLRWLPDGRLATAGFTGSGLSGETGSKSCLLRPDRERRQDGVIALGITADILLTWSGV